MSIKEQMDRAFKIGEDLIYLIIGILLFFTALIMLGTSIYQLVQELHSIDVIKTALHIIDKILLTIMVVEILYTVRISLKSHILCAEPFLIVALIAAIRRILLISVESAYDLDKFTYHMSEMGILGAIILIFTWSIILLRKHSKTDS